MSNPTSALYKTPTLAQNQFQMLDFYFSTSSGTPSLTPVSNASPIIFGISAAAPLDQTTIDAFIGSGEIVAATAFSATAMGVDSMGFVINMNGQALEAVSVEAILYHSTVANTGAVASTSALTSSLSTAVTVTTLGNLYGRVVPAGLDASTCLMHLRVAFRLK